MRIVALFLVLSVVALSIGAGLLAQESSPDELIASGDRFFERKTYKQALAAYEAYLLAAPDGPKAHHARMQVANSLLGIRQRWQAVERLKAFLGKTKPATQERAEITRLLGGTLVEHWGGRTETIAWLDEALTWYAGKGMKAEQIGVLFDIAVGLSHAWGYDIEYATWEKEPYKPNPDDVKLSWDDYRKKEMKRQDDARYERVVATYGKILELADKGPDAPKALYRLGAFHVNVLATAFGNSANYYPGTYEGEQPEEMEKALLRYHGEIDKGFAAWEQILADFGTSPYADDAQYLIAMTHHMRLNDFGRAVTEYEVLLEQHKSEWALTARSALQQIRKEEIRLQVAP